MEGMRGRRQDFFFFFESVVVCVCTAPWHTGQHTTDGFFLGNSVVKRARCRVGTYVCTFDALPRGKIVGVRGISGCKHISYLKILNSALLLPCVSVGTRQCR